MKFVTTAIVALFATVAFANPAATAPAAATAAPAAATTAPAAAPAEAAPAAH